MSVFQIILLAVIGTLLVLALATFGRGGTPIGVRLLWIATLAAGAIATIWPDATTLIANRVGIRRGADLVLYSSVVVMFAGFAMLYVRLRETRREVTQLVRHIALMEAERKS